MIREGYQQTVIGLIPCDWEVVLLGNLFSFKNGLNKAKEFFGYGTPIVNYMDVFRNSVIYYSELEGRVSLSKQEIQAFEVRKGDVFFTRTSETPEEIGIASVIFDEPSQTVFSGFILRARPKNEILCNEFKAYCFGSNFIRKQIISKASYTTRALTNGRILSAVVLPVPPLPEQKAIAEVLGDVDRLINACDKLIAKKRDIKQGAMQELLTGRSRLPGFSGEWEVKNLLETSTLKARIGWQGLTTKEYLDQGEYFLITGTDFENGKIKWSTCCFVDKVRYHQDKNIQIKTKDILITKDGTIGKIAYINFLPLETTLNSGVFVIRPKNQEYEPLYFYYVLMSEIFNKFLTRLKAGSTISHLYQKDFINFNFPLPPTIEEQKAIAQILSDMDSEIEALEKKRDKYKLIKQGMMQELLTGKTRLL
jgi:type I restriction enzyme S subunit